MVKAMYGNADQSSDYGIGANPSRRRHAQLGGGALYDSNLSDGYEGDLQTWAVGYDYNFSKRTKVYALYTSVTNDAKDVVAGSEWDGFSLGMMHSF